MLTELIDDIDLDNNLNQIKEKKEVIFNKFTQIKTKKAIAKKTSIIPNNYLKENENKSNIKLDINLNNFSETDQEIIKAVTKAFEICDWQGAHNYNKFFLNKKRNCILDEFMRQRKLIKMMKS